MSWNTVREEIRKILNGNVGGMKYCDLVAELLASFRNGDVLVDKFDIENLEDMLNEMNGIEILRYEWNKIGTRVVLKQMFVFTP